MPEGDTVWRTARRLDEALGRRVLTRSDFRVPRFATTELAGRVVHEALSRGKHLLIRVDGSITVHTHLRMDGSWRIWPARRPPPRDHRVRLVLENADWQAVGYLLGVVEVLPTTLEDRAVGHLGPDLLGPDWDAAEAVRRLSGEPGRPVGEALLDQRKLAGIGNLYKCEALFVERTNPWTQVGNVADLRRLVVTAQRLMRVNRDHPEQSTTGMSGRGREHWVYRRAGSACRRCRTPIRHEIQGAAPYQRDTFWCPTCQPAR